LDEEFAMFARINSPETFETEVQAALRLPALVQFLATPNINFDINIHFKFFVLLEIGDKHAEIKQICARVDFPALYAKIPQARSIFELACYQELFMAGKVDQKVLKMDPSTPKTDVRSITSFYDTLLEAYRKMVAQDPQVEREVDLEAPNKVFPEAAVRSFDSESANKAGRIRPESGSIFGPYSLSQLLQDPARQTDSQVRAEIILHLPRPD
jgi:hypothetical protein